MNELTRTPETVGAEIRGLTAQAKQMPSIRQFWAGKPVFAKPYVLNTIRQR